MTGIAFVLFALAGKSTSKKPLALGCAECETTSGLSLLTSDV